MRTIKTLVVASAAFAGVLAVSDVLAQRQGGNGGGRGGGGYSGSGGSHGAARHGNGGARHGNGGSHHGHGGYRHGGHGHGHGHHHGGRYWYGGGYYGYWAAPLLWGAYWGYPYYGYGAAYPYYDYYGPQVVYREAVPAEPQYPEGQIAPAPGEAGAPSQGPLYMNYCASSKAYFPKVTSCPEGWKFISPGS